MPEKNRNQVASKNGTEEILDRLKTAEELIKVRPGGPHEKLIDFINEKREEFFVILGISDQNEKGKKLSAFLDNFKEDFEKAKINSQKSVDFSPIELLIGYSKFIQLCFDVIEKIPICNHQEFK